MYHNFKNKIELLIGFEIKINKIIDKQKTKYTFFSMKSFTIKHKVEVGSTWVVFAGLMSTYDFDVFLLH